MKRILILILVFVMTASFPCIAFASSLPSGDEYKVNVHYTGNFVIGFWASGYTQGTSSSKSFNQDWSVTLSNTTQSIVRTTFYFDEIIESYRSLFENATNVWFSTNFNGVIDSGGVASSGFCELYYYLDNNAFNLVGSSDFSTGYLNGNLNFSPVDIKSALASESWDELKIFYNFTTNFKSAQDASPLAMVRDFSCVFYLQGINGQSHDQFIVITNDLNNIDASVKQVASEVKVMQGQLDNIQSDINSGFNEVGGKLDSMLTPDSSNQQAVDQMGGQVNNNKQEAEDIKNQIDSLDKPDPDDLIDKIDPDQFVDSDDEAVQEMTGILASVTGSKVVKNYLLLLICVGIVSFVVYGKKGG